MQDEKIDLLYVNLLGILYCAPEEGDCPEMNEMYADMANLKESIERYAELKKEEIEDKSIK